MKTIITASIILVLFCEPASSYPIDPRPLRKLIMESEYIVIGYVLEVEERKEKKDSFGPSSVARIAVREVLQGNIKGQIIEVPFHANFICPAPAVYVPKTDVLAFLDKRKGQYYTHALSYGAKTMSTDQLEIYKNRIVEMQKILTITDVDRKFVETIEWLVKCAEHVATRWEGVYELSPESDFMSYYSRSEHPPFKYLITPEQKQRLKTALLNTTELGYGDFGLVDLVYVGNEDEIYQYLLSGLKKLPDDRMWMAEDYMMRLLYRKNSPELENLLNEYSDKRFDDDKARELKSIVSSFIVEIEKI